MYAIKSARVVCGSGSELKLNSCPPSVGGYKKTLANLPDLGQMIYTICSYFMT